jgi:HNH endonuclease
MQSKELEDVPGYFIYPDGKVWSKKTNKFLKDQRGGYKGEYRKYSLWLNGKYVNKYVHILVMTYFGPAKPGKKYEINHINGNKFDNFLDNLEWVTSSENTKHGVKTGLFSRVILTIDQVTEIKKRFKHEPDYYGKVSDIAKEYGVSYQVISQIKHNRNWNYVEIE